MKSWVNSMRRFYTGTVFILALAEGSALAQPAPAQPPPPAPKPASPSPAPPGPPLPPKPPAGPRTGTGVGEAARAKGKAGAPAPTGAKAKSDVTGAGDVEEVPGQAAFNQCRKLPAGKKVKFTLKPESELIDLIGWISAMTCKKFIVPQNIRSQKVTIVSPTPVTPDEGYRLFLSALNSIGLTVAPAGDALQVVETPRIKEEAPVYRPDEPAPSDDRYITRLIRLQNVPAAEMGAVLQKLRSKDGDVSWYDPTSTLILTDTASNVRRMMEVVQSLDTPGTTEKIWIVKLHNTSAADMAQKLAEIFQVAGGAAGKPGAPGGAPVGGPRKVPGVGTSGLVESPGEIAISKIIPDDRTNSLIIVANEHAYARIYALIKRLDSSKDEAEALGEGRIHVYQLANANADELAQTLGGVTGAQVTVGGGGGGRRGGAPPRPGAPPPAPPPGGGAPGGGGVSTLFEGEVRISADKPTNALVIISSVKDFLTLKSVIRRLDIPRRQVFIEATIMEVSLDRSRQLGLWFHGGDIVGSGNDQTLIFGGSGAAKTLVPANLIGDLAQGLAAGALGPEIQGADQILNQPGISIPAFGVFLKALATSNDVNVLSTPHIITTDNEEAEIKVGQNLPFPGATFGTTPGLPGATGGAPGATPGAGSPFLGFGGFTPVNRQDVALDLKITPHVNESGMVRLEVDQEISDVLSENFNGLGPATSKRTVKTVVVVHDQQPVVLGGLVTDRLTNSENKVPLLGDIPILGYFFKNTTKRMQKNNLLVFLTPYVVTDQSDLKRIFERKLEERREFLERYTAFHDQRDFDAKVDYRSKRGLLEEINRTAREADEEAEVMAKIREAQMSEDQGPVELPPGYRPVKTVPAAPAPSAPPSAPPGTQPPGSTAPTPQNPIVPGTPPGTPPSRINPPKPD